MIDSLLRCEALGSVGAHQPLDKMASRRAERLIRCTLSHELRALDTLVQFLHPVKIRKNELKFEFEKLFWSHLLSAVTEGTLAHQHKVDAASCRPKIYALIVHLTPAEDLRGSIDMRAHSWCEHLHASCLLFILHSAAFLLHAAQIQGQARHDLISC